MRRFLTGSQPSSRAPREGARPRPARCAEDRPGRCRVAARVTGAALAVVLVLYGLQAAGAGAAQAALVAGTKGVAPAPVSNAFSLGGGVGGSVDQRTGAFQASLPLVNVAGRAGTGLSLSLSYDQSLAAQGVDRFGLGAGWSLGVPWVNTAGGVHVYPASGGSYAYDAGSPTGLYQYPLQDLSFAKNPGTIPARPGVAAQAYVYTLTLLDGTVDRFDANGNLVEQADPFGNPIDLTWKQSGPRWQPTSVADSYGQVTRFDYTSPGQIKVIAPVSAEGVTASVALKIEAGRLTQVTDALGQQTSFGYSPVTGLPDPLLGSVVSPAGEHTRVTYTPLAYEPELVVVNTVTVTDPARADVLAPLHFIIDPPGNNRHNYTGYPNHVKTGSDGLFNSGDFGYRYSTELSNGTSTVEATYNSLHLLTTQKVYAATPGQGNVLNQAQTYTYPPVTSVAHLPANYAKPTATTIVYGDPTYGATRTVTTASGYDDRGLLTSATNAAGTITRTAYNAYGLPATQTVTGADGATSVTTDTFTEDGKAVRTATTAVGATSASATARTVATYAYNSFGQVTGELLAWASGAKPPGDSGGPDQIDDTNTISADTAAHTATDVVTTAAGTPSAASTTIVTDLVTGQVLSQTNPGKLTTSYRYDALGRTVAVTVPGGQTTTTAYPTPLITDTTAPSGLVTQTTTDVTGRTVKVSDNVAGQKLVADPAARTVETDRYSTDGSQLTTTTPAGTTTTTFDPLGRPTEMAKPGGITQTDAYNDVANTQTVSVLPAKATGPVSVTKDSFDALNQPTASSTAYPDGTPQTPTAEAYDGLGRVSSYSAGNLTATPAYTGAGGLQTGTVLTPTDPAGFPGQPVTADTGNTMTGALTVKTLTGQSKTATGGGAADGAAYTYDAAGRVRTATDPAGQTTAYTYTPAGQIATVTAPSGAVTTYTYNPGTGRLDRTDVRGTDGTTQDTAYTYDPATGLVKSVYDPEHPADAITYDYDPDGHVTAVHYPDGSTTAATYQDNGQPATTTDITGAVTTYTYNTSSSCGTNLEELCQATQTRDGAPLASVAYTYDNLDRVHTITRANGITTTLTYTDASQVKTETTTTTADGTMLRADTYTYDDHGNTKTHTTTSALPAPAAPGQAAARRLAASPAATTTTTAYGYDAYNRLIDSALYPGATATGTPTTSTHYTINVAGDVTGQTTTTAAGAVTTVNTIDPGDRLTARTVNGVATLQAFDADGNVTRDLAGNTYTYNLTGQQDSVTTPAGVTTTYTYWPDRTRRAATTVADGITHLTTYHYATTGRIANDAYTGGGPAVTASYLLAVNREARTLVTTGSTGPAAAQTAGAGTGYYLTDAHGSVIALIDSQRQAAAYDYGDYGAPVGAGPATAAHPAPAPAGNAAVNPFTYDGACTNPTTGTQYLPARTYDPGQGRFLSLDSATEINRYQAFATNPITNTDPTGQLAIPQILTDAFAAALFIAFGVLSGGAAAPVLAGLVAGEEIATGAIAVAALNAVSAATNIAAAGTSITLTANDAAELTGNGFLSDSQKEDLTTATTALGTIAGITGAAAGVVDSLKPIEAAASATTGESTSSSFLSAEEENTLTRGASDLAQESRALGDDFSGSEADKFLGSEDSSSSEESDTEESSASSSPRPQLGSPVAAPEILTAADQQFAAIQQQAGQAANFNPIVPPDAGQPPLATDPPAVIPAAVPIVADPSLGSSNVGVGTQIAESATTALQHDLSSNTPNRTPAPASISLGSNLQPPTIITPAGGLSPGNPLGNDAGF